MTPFASPRIPMAFAALSFAGVASAQGELRATLSLDSGWQSVMAPHGAATPPASGWRPTAVPGFADLGPQGGSRDLWYRRSLRIPAEWSRRRILLDLQGARYAPQVYLDGRLVGSQFDGWSPMEVELTSHVRSGATHELVVRCQDWGATFPDGFVWPPGTGENALRGKVFAPIGGYKNHFGITAPALLHARPRHRLREKDLRIETSVRKGELSVAGLADPRPPGARVYIEVVDKARHVVRRLEASIRPDGSWQARTKFPRARHWSPEDPYLYDLRITLRRGAVLDQIHKRFGFREFWTEGPHFVLNGVRRHLLASSTWPVTAWSDPTEVRKRVRAAKAAGIDTFRMHIGPWQEEYGDAADEIGLLLIAESAVYTDGSGFYAYQEPLFWRRYQEHLAAMIRRDRNHPSIVMWSLGNEILFMGNERYDANLPTKLGDLARFARKLDPTRPLTYEADIDPDGAYDVIGLHYPHELPNQYAYPEAGDWLGSRKETEAAGGMLGQKRSGFQWDRRKPLFIGEYLWVPQGDYSPGSVYFGDDAYLNREKMNMEAKARSWIDQTVAYRRAGVSGLSPWTAMEFGMLPGPRVQMDAQRVYYRRQAAFLRERGLRFFSGERAKLRFDVFNDVPKASSMVLQLLEGARVVASRTVRLDPAGYADLSLAYDAPKVEALTRRTLRFRLVADGREVDRGDLAVSCYPRSDLSARNVTVYDPEGKWPGSVRTLDQLSAATTLVVAPGALSEASPAASGLPLVGGSRFDGPGFRRFLAEGGRAVVLEQTTLAPLGLGVSLVEHPSTMTFAVAPGHPVLRGLAPEDLKHWRGDGYVTRHEIRRVGGRGLRAITVSGGPDSLAQAPIAEMAIGRGHVLFVQYRAGEKRGLDPAAQTLLRNAVGYVAGIPARRSGSTTVIGAPEAFSRQLREIGLGSGTSATGIVLQGGGLDVTASRPAIESALRRGGQVYWRLPTPDAFRTLRSALGQPDLEAVEDPSGPALVARDHASLRGVSREDLLFTTPPQSWNRLTSPKGGVATHRFVPRVGPGGSASEIPLSSATLDRGRIVRDGGQPAVFFPRRGEMSFRVDGPSGRYRTLTVDAKGNPGDGQSPVVEVRVDDQAIGWFEVGNEWRSRPFNLLLPKSSARITLSFANGGDWGGPRTLSVRRISLSEPFDYPAGVSVLASPGTLLTWRHPNGGTVIVDGIAWERSPEDAVRGRRYLSALLANHGFAFTSLSEDLGDALPISKFRTAGGQYNTADAARIELRSSGTAEIEFQCGSDGEYVVSLLGSSTPCEGEFARAQVFVDDVAWGERTLASVTDARYDLEPRRLSAGRHRLRLVFPNDASTATEDRNLTIRQITFRRADTSTP